MIRTCSLCFPKTLYPVSVLLVVMGFLLLASPCRSVAADDENSSEIRQPQGNEDSEAFWNKFHWTDLTHGEQTQWQKLGWNQANWEGKAPEPASEKKAWNALTAEERSAAKGPWAIARKAGM